jgi:hypothetical protein
MEAAASQEPDFTDAVATSRSELLSLNQSAISSSLSSQLNDHLEALTKQFLLVSLHYRGHPPDSSAPVRTIRKLLMDAYDDLEVYYLRPDSLLAKSAEDKWKSFLKHVQNGLFIEYAQTMDALDSYEQAAATLDEKMPPSSPVSETKAATEWKMACRETLLQKLEGFQIALSVLSNRGVSS